MGDDIVRIGTRVLRLPTPPKPDQLASHHAVAPRLVQTRLPWLEQIATQYGPLLGSALRPLTTREKELAREVFAYSINLEVVRIASMAMIERPRTPGNVIWESADPRHRMDDATLIHELTHVWQYQTSGSGYISSSILCQVFEKNAYTIHGSQLDLVRSFKDLSAERQATVVEMYFICSLLISKDPRVRERAEYEYQNRIWLHMTQRNDFRNPELGKKQFDYEVSQLERLMEEVRRAHPLQIDRYTETMYGQAHGPRFSTNDSAYGPTSIMPIVRFEF